MILFILFLSCIFSKILGQTANRFGDDNYQLLSIVILLCHKDQYQQRKVLIATCSRTMLYVHPVLTNVEENLATRLCVGQMDQPICLTHQLLTQKWGWNTPLFPLWWRVDYLTGGVNNLKIVMYFSDFLPPLQLAGQMKILTICQLCPSDSYTTIPSWFVRSVYPRTTNTGRRNLPWPYINHGGRGRDLIYRSNSCGIYLVMNNIQFVVVCTILKIWHYKG